MGSPIKRLLSRTKTHNFMGVPLYLTRWRLGLTASPAQQYTGKKGKKGDRLKAPVKVGKG
jgi:hypothetical protein